LKIIKRTESPFRDTPGGMVLVATGSLYSFTIVHPGKEKQPYGLAMVDFAPGVRAFGRLLFGTEAPAIGSRLRVVPFALPDGTPDYAFQE